MKMKIIYRNREGLRTAKTKRIDNEIILMKNIDSLKYDRTPKLLYLISFFLILGIIIMNIIY